MVMYPPWSYSQSRANMFNECLRKYYYHYYGSHNGWNPEQSTPEQATLYRLKQLSNLYLWFGDLTHRMCQSAVQALDQGKSVPRTAFLQQAMKDMLNQGYQESKDVEAWLQQPKRRLMLAEMYYQEEDKLRDRIMIIKERLGSVSQHLYTSETWSELQRSGSQIVEVEKWDTMLLHETKTFVKMDLLYRRSNGRMVIVDWKTGKKEDFTDQLYLYASYVRDTYNLPLQDIELRVEYLATGEQETYQATSEDIQRVELQVGRDLDEMKSCLEDEYYNRPRPMSYFTPMPSRRAWGGCNFREVCEYRVY